MIMKIIVYGTEFCPDCKRAKDFLEENEIKFEYIDVGKDKKAAKDLIEKTGQRKVPVIEIDDEMIIGFNAEKILKKLNL